MNRHYEIPKAEGLWLRASDPEMRTASLIHIRRAWQINRWSLDKSVRTPWEPELAYYTGADGGGPDFYAADWQQQGIPGQIFLLVGFALIFLAHEKKFIVSLLRPYGFRLYAEVYPAVRPRSRRVVPRQKTLP